MDGMGYEIINPLVRGLQVKGGNSTINFLVYWLKTALSKKEVI